MSLDSGKRVNCYLSSSWNGAWILTPSNSLFVSPSSLTMPSFLTPKRHPYSARFSPHHPNLIAVAASQFYGFAGGGSLYVLELDDVFNLTLIERKNYEWSDGLFDVVRETEIILMLPILIFSHNSLISLAVLVTAFIKSLAVQLWRWISSVVEHWG